MSMIDVYDVPYKKSQPFNITLFRRQSINQDAVCMTVTHMFSLALITVALVQFMTAEAHTVNYLNFISHYSLFYCTYIPSIVLYSTLASKSLSGKQLRDFRKQVNKVHLFSLHHLFPITFSFVIFSPWLFSSCFCYNFHHT